MTLIFRLFAALLCAAAILPAHATVIDFEELGLVPCTDAPISSRGYTFAGDDFFHCVVPAGLPTPNANNGSSFLIEGSAFLTITHDSGGSFSLRSADLGTSFFNDTAPNLMLATAQTLYHGVVSRVLVVNDEFERFRFNGFNDLVSLTFSGLLLPSPDGSQGYFALDNLVVQVPLPGSAPLMLLGLGVLTLSRRAGRGVSRPRAAS